MSAPRQIPLFGEEPTTGEETPERSDRSEAGSDPGRPAAGTERESPEAADPSPAEPSGAAISMVAEPGEGAEEAVPGSSLEHPLPVSSLNARARALLEREFGPLWVVGEVEDWRRASSGHCYFSLRDESARISCVMWRSEARRLPTEPEEGMEVCAFGQVSLYEARGTYQIVVRRLEAKGEGLWRLAFERLRRKLAEEGLLDEERKRSLPAIPMTVGVVTSRTAAALRDVVSVVRRRAPWTSVLVSDCRVQGEEAAEEIVAALERLVRRGSVDVVIVTRGGGSVEDLWAFNREEVARAVASCPIPVISAVGHEVDVTITDLVADVRAPTPSAAAEVAVPDVRSLRARLRGLAEGLVTGLRSRTVRGEERVRRAAERLVSGVRRRLERWESRIRELGGRLDALSPIATLERGYAVPLDDDGRVLRRVRDFTVGDAFRLRVVDGTVECRAEGSEPLEEGDGGGV